MFEFLKRRSRVFLSAPCGSRFRAHYERARTRPNLMRTLLVVGFGLIVLALGLVMIVLPGPGLLVAVIGAVLIAGESLTAARVLDRIDLTLSRIWKRLRQR